MAKLIPNPENQQEEVLEPIFERNQSYKNQKEKRLKAALAKNLPAKKSGLAWVFGALGALTTTMAVIFLIFSSGINLYNPLNPNQKLSSGIEVSAQEIEIRAVNNTLLGVQPNTEFEVISQKKLDKNELLQNLKIVPEKSFELTQISDTNFKIKFKEVLTDNQIYQFKLNIAKNNSDLRINKANSQNEPSQTKELSWAFQTKNQFRVLGSLPKDKAVVPLNTGIEIYLNTTEFNADENVLRSNFEIEPKTEGKISKNGRTLIFVPKELKPETVYTVKLKKELSLSDNSQNLASDYEFQFETTYSDNPSENLEIPEFLELKTDEKIQFPVCCENVNANSNFTVNIYNISNDQKLISQVGQNLKAQTYWMWSQQKQTPIDLSKIAPEKSFKIRVNVSNNDKNLLIPENLEKGIYAIETILGEQKAQMILQISDISAFIQEYENQTLVWAQNLENQTPLVGAKVSKLGETQEYSTDSQGIATFDTPKKTEENFSSVYKVQTESETLYLPVKSSFSYRIGGNRSYDYWSNLYTDRRFYKPTDKIHFFGYLQARKNFITPNKVTVKLDSGGNFENNYQSSNLLTQEVEVKNNIFEGELVFDKALIGIYNLEISDEKGVIITQNLEIIEFTKPTYDFQVKVDKQNYFVDEAINYTGSINFFDGTPAKNLEIGVRVPEGSNSAKFIKTDEQGNFSYQDNSKDRFRSSSFNDVYTSYSLTFYPRFSEESSNEMTTSVTVFRHRTNVNIDSQVNNNQITLKIELNDLDLSKDSPTLKENLGKAQVNKEVKITADEYEEKQVETGEFYNQITKKNEKQYRTEQVFVKGYVFERTLQTDKNGKIETSFQGETNKIYKFSVVAKDTDQKTEIYRELTLRNIGQNQNNSSNNYLKEFDLQVGPDNTFSDKKYRVGQKIDLSFKNYDKIMAPKTKPNKYLLITAQNGLKNYEILIDPEFSIEFKEDWIPNVFLQGVHFDGKTFNYSSQNILLEVEDKKLDIDIKADKTDYKPGETVKLKIESKDKNSQAVAAKINLSVVDEAIMKTWPHEPTIKDVYSQLPSGEISSYSSHKKPTPRTGGRGGFGGLPAPRSKFLDTVFFKTVETNGNGETEVEFKLPDNLTSWRITYQGISKGLENSFLVGDGKINVNVSLPFFASAVISPTFLTSDKPKIKLTASGSELQNTDKVEFEINSKSLNIVGSKFETTGNTPVELNLENGSNKLQTGDYEVEIKAKILGQDKYTDSIIRKFKVVESYISVTKTNYEQYQNGQDLITTLGINGISNQNQTLTFSNAETGKIYEKLLSLSNSVGERLENQLAANLAKNLLNQEFGEKIITEDPEEQNLLRFQNPDGGLAIYPYSSSDLKLTVIGLKTSAESFDKNAAKIYLNNILNDQKESQKRKLYALYGLSALLEPILVDLQLALRNLKLNPKEKLIVALSLINLGDTETARKIYTELKNNLVAEAESAKFNYFDEEVKQNNEQKSEQIAYNSLLAAILESDLGETNADKLFEYADKYEPESGIWDLEKILYLKKASQNNSKQVEFSYNLGGTIETKILNKNETLSLQLFSQNLASLNIVVKSGNLGITSTYQKGLEMRDITANWELRRQYKVNETETANFKDGEFVTVELNVDLKDYKFREKDQSCLLLTDYLPSGLMFIEQKYYDSKTDIYSNFITNDGQKVQFCILKAIRNEGQPTALNPNKIKIQYTAKVRNKGEFIASQVTLQDLSDPKMLTFTDSKIVTIN